jgi:hypothetical protein
MTFYFEADQDPDSGATFYFDADQDPDTAATFYLMPIKIWIRMRLSI